MGRNLIAYGPQSWPHLATTATATQLASIFRTIRENGFDEVGRESWDEPLSFREAVTLVSSGETGAVVLLPGWGEDAEALALGRNCLLLYTDVFHFDGPNFDLVRLTFDNFMTNAYKDSSPAKPTTTNSDTNDPNTGEPEETPAEEAARIIRGARNDFYDTPRRNLTATGTIWSGILQRKLLPGETITAEEVSLCMVGLKLARQSYRHKRDNLTDAHGYLIAIEMIQEDQLAEEQRQQMTPDSTDPDEAE